MSDPYVIYRKKSVFNYLDNCIGQTINISNCNYILFSQSMLFYRVILITPNNDSVIHLDSEKVYLNLKRNNNVRCLLTEKKYQNIIDKRIENMIDENW